MSQLKRSTSSLVNNKCNHSNVYDHLFNKRPSLNSVYNSSLSSSSEDYDNENSNNNYYNRYIYVVTSNNPLETSISNGTDIIELYREPKRIQKFDNTENYDNFYESTQILTPKSIHINLVSGQFLLLFFVDYILALYLLDNFEWNVILII
jgi:hypothetical protein